MLTSPPDPGRLGAICGAAEEVFQEYHADNIDRIDVLAKLTAYTLFCSQLPDRDKAIAEFTRMMREYLQRFDMLATPASGTA